jgi:hypothetical protein
MPSTNDITELFGYEASDTSEDAALFWQTRSCPFVGEQCSKRNHDGSIIYGTCSVSSNHGDVIICPKRLYAEDYQILRTVARDVFKVSGFATFPEYLKQKRDGGALINDESGYVVALGQLSGKEVSVANQMSMDWVLVHVKDGKISSYTGVEVQSIDITGNYRDNWHYYKQWRDSGSKPTTTKPSSNHGYNWANVHKRLIPQLIRKGMVYSRSDKVTQGLSFVLPDEVFVHFEEILGTDFETPAKMSADVLSIYTYALGPKGKSGTVRALVPKRKLQVTLSEFSERFVSGPNLPDGNTLDTAVSYAIGLQFLR